MMTSTKAQNMRATARSLGTESLLDLFISICENSISESIDQEDVDDCRVFRSILREELQRRLYCYDDMLDAARKWGAK